MAWVITNFSSSRLVVEVVPSKNHCPFGWDIAGEGAFGLTNAISLLALELERRARLALLRETTQPDLFTSVAELELDARVRQVQRALAK